MAKEGWLPDPERNRTYGNRPSAGQSKPYNSGDNTHSANQKPRQGPKAGEKSDVMPMAGPRSGAGGGRTQR